MKPTRQTFALNDRFSVELTYGLDGTITSVDLLVGNEVALSTQPEMLERIASLLKDVREEHRDYRRVCPEHGYYPEQRKDGGYGCTVCDPGPTKVVAPPEQPPVVGKDIPF